MTSFSLLIKSPSEKFEPFPITIESFLTIWDLKQRLSQVYPSKPDPQHQKLVYAGRLLENDKQLKDIIQSDRPATFVFHLVVSQPQPPTPPPIYHQPIPNHQPQNNDFFAQRFGNPPPANQFQPNPWVQQQQQQPQRPANHHPQQNYIWLIAKLALLVYIFGQGGSSSRIAFLSIAAFVIFLYQTGLLPFSFEFRVPQRNVGNVNQENRTEQRNEQLNDGEQAQRPRGIIGEIYGIIIPFFLSLFPTWQPQMQNIQ